MNLDDYKSDWKKRHSELASDRFDTLASDTAAQVLKFESAIWRRDLLETVAAVVVVAFFCIFLWTVPCPLLMQVGIGIVVLGAIESVVVMHWTRHRDAQPKHGLPLLDFCTTELKRIDRQIHLIRNVNWWYSGPILLGCCITFYGALNSIPELPAHIRYGFLAAFYVCFFAAGYIVYRININAIESDLAPIRNELAEIVCSLEIKVGGSDSHSD